MRSFIALLAIAAMPLVPFPAAGAADDRVEIERAFETVFDQSRPLDERLPLIDGADKLKSLFKAIPREYDDVTARARNVRVHGRKAEARLELYKDRRPLIGLPLGAAVQKDGRWLVSGFTVCEVVNWVRPCSQHLVSDAYYADTPFAPGPGPGGLDGEVGLALPDGTALALRPASTFDVARFSIRSEAALEAGGDGSPIGGASATAYFRPPPAPTLARYRGADGSVVTMDYRGSLNFEAGDWVVRVSAANLSEVERTFLARHLRVTLTVEGFVQFLGDEAVYLKAAEPPSFGGPGRSVAALPAKGGVLRSSPALIFTPLHGSPPYFRVELAHTGCTDPGRIGGLLPEDLVATRCFDGGIELAVQGSDPASVRTFINETTLRVVRAAP